MGKETSERIQTSVLNAAEKKVLVWLAQRQPAWVTSDFLTYTGVVGGSRMRSGIRIGSYR